MAVLSDNIEEFLISLIDEEEEPVILVQRNELANYFRCAPSQINYVLSTRFTIDRGYTVESRRGGGGYIRIVRMSFDDEDYLSRLVENGIDDVVSEEDAFSIINRLMREETITARECALAKSVLSDKTLAIPSPIKERLRANILRQMLIQWMTNKDKK